MTHIEIGILSIPIENIKEVTITGDSRSQTAKIDLLVAYKKGHNGYKHTISYVYPTYEKALEIYRQVSIFHRKELGLAVEE